LCFHKIKVKNYILDVPSNQFGNEMIRINNY